MPPSANPSAATAFSSRLFDPTSPIGSQYSNSRKKRVTFGDGGDGNADYRHTSARVPSSSLSAGSDPSWWAPIAPTAAVSPSPSPSSSLLYSPGLRDQGYNRYGSYGYRQSYQTDLHGPEHTMMMAMGGGFDSPMQTIGGQRHQQNGGHDNDGKAFGDLPPPSSLEQHGATGFGRPSSSSSSLFYDGSPTAARSHHAEYSHTMDASTRRERRYTSTPASALRSPTQLDPHFDTGISTTNIGLLSPNAGHWITVFGFPPSKVSYVLKKFSVYGEILEHRMGEGNWMHIMYRKRIQAQRALSKNGKIFDSTLMIGTFECIDPEVIGKQFRGTIPSEPIFSPGRISRSSGLLSTTRKRKYRSVSSPEENASRMTSVDGQPPEKRRLLPTLERDAYSRPEPQRSWLSSLTDMIFKF